MKCPACHFLETRVVDSRAIDEGMAIRRRRECDKCLFRFSTYEEVEILNLTVKKRNGREEVYDREKLVAGLKKSVEKRPVTLDRFKRLVNAIERDIQLGAKNDRISSEKIGEFVMRHLKRLDKVAYIRFASVCQSFKNIEMFHEEVENLVSKKH
ncbi:MAG: transcriptional regulator NrdR [Patescibacteria group bacterium]